MAAEPDCKLTSRMLANVPANLDFPWLQDLLARFPKVVPETSATNSKTLSPQMDSCEASVAPPNAMVAGTAQIRSESPELVELKSRYKTCHFEFSQHDQQDDVSYTACPRCQKPRTIYSNAPKTLLSARQRQPGARPPIHEQESHDSFNHNVIHRSHSRAPDIKESAIKKTSPVPESGDETATPRRK